MNSLSMYVYVAFLLSLHVQRGRGDLRLPQVPRKEGKFYEDSVSDYLNCSVCVERQAHYSNCDLCCPSAHETESDCLFVSHQTGQDSPICGSLFQPCKTLPQALLMVSNGGKICLDGRKSESHPYGCNTTEKMEALLKDKSITVQGWHSKAYVSCLLPFNRSRDFILRITLSNLVFHNSGVIIRNVSCFSVVVTNCTFVNSTDAIVILQRESRVCNVSSLVITDSEFFNNTKYVFVGLFNRFFILNISKCNFLGKVGRFQAMSRNRETRAAVYIRSANLTYRVDIFGSVTDSIFRELGHEDNSFALSFRVDNFYSKGHLALSNTTFLNNENGLFVFGGFDVQLTKVTVNSTYGYGFSAGGPPKLWPNVTSLKVYLEQCILWNSKCGVRMATSYCVSANIGCLTSSQTLVVRNSLFLGGDEMQVDGYAVRFWVEGDTFRRPSFIKAKLQLENVTFFGLNERALSVGFQAKVEGMISVKNCKFMNNSQFVQKMDGRYRAIVEIEFDDEDPPNCPKQKRNKSNKRERSAITRVPVIFEDSIFQNNVGVSAAIDFLNAKVTFKNCIFKDNRGLTVGGHVYMEPGYGSVNIVNSTFLQTCLNAFSDGKQRSFSSIGCFLHSESAGPITITNSSFTANVITKYNPMLAATRTNLITADATSTFRCPSGKRIKLDKTPKPEDFQFTKDNETCLMKVTYVKLFCEECPDEFYSLQRGLTTGLDINNRTMCLKCPYGASCVGGNITAKENFWGLNMSTNPPSLQFFPCPLEYCSSPEYSNYYTYNACFGKRSGVLCGKCSDGYSEALYSTSCRKKEKCNDHWFWLTTAIYVIFFAVYFVFKPPIFSALYKQTLWFKRNRTGDAYVQILPQEDDKEYDPGYLKIIFYFYQVAELVMIKSPEKTLHMVPFIPSVIAIFNFQVKAVDGSVGCPFPGLTVVTKELFLCLKFLATLFFVGFIFTIHRAASSSRYISSPRITVYLAVALEILLLGYNRLADTTLKLMHCVPIGMDWNLFVDGNIQCWQWWQYLLIVFMMVFIIPLIVVLFWGSLSLANGKMSAKEFLTACVFPLPCLLVWVVRRCKKTEDNDVPNIGNPDDSEEIKKVLHDPFRAPSCDDHGTLYWESVLTGRRLILLTIHTFATDPIVKFLCLDFACVLILVHHLSMRPFRDRKANIFESLSLVSLFAICTFSLAEAAYLSEGIEPTGPSESLFHTLQWIEIGVLGLVPVVVGILVVFTLLSQVVRFLYYCVKLLSFNRVNSLGYLEEEEEEEEPLLINAAQGNPFRC